MISVSTFVDTYEAEWLQRTNDADGRNEIAARYPESVQWTDYMQAPETGMVSTICKSIREQQGPFDLTYQRHVYTVDALLVAAVDPTDLLGLQSKGYPGELHALIEHENAGAVEEEMWKLLWWRCPLKIIIFYDYSQDECDNNTEKKGWLSAKLDGLNQRLIQVDHFYSENAETRYLLLIGQRQSVSPLPKWKYVVLPDLNLTTRDLF